MAPPRARAPVLFLAIVATLVFSATPRTAAQRLSAFLTPSDIAALRGGGGEDGKRGASSTRILDPPALSCVDEEAAADSVVLEVCAAESGAPFGVLVEWMGVVAFARSNGWLRGDDERLCRLRLTAPVARGDCRDVVVGGEAMIEQLNATKPHHHLDKNEGGQGGKKHGSGGGAPPAPPPTPQDAVIGEEACRDGLQPDSFYVFRARARGDGGESLKEGSKEMEGDDDDEAGGGEKKEHGEGQEEKKEEEDHERSRPTVEPSLWSDNEVCSTAPATNATVGGPGMGDCAVPPPPPPPPLPAVVTSDDVAEAAELEATTAGA